MKPIPDRLALSALAAILLAFIPRIASATDLTVNQEAAVPFALDWASKKAIAEIVNRGDKPAGTFVVQLGISHPGALASMRPQARSRITIPGLAPGESYLVSVQVADFEKLTVDPLSLSTGRFEVRIDTEDDVKETNEDNNFFTDVF